MTDPQPQAATAASFARPYPPSWIDALTDWVDRLPAPWWAFYAALALAMSGAVALALWLTGTYAAIGFHPMQLWLPSLPAYLLAFMHGIDRAALAALERFRPAFDGGAAEFATAAYRMTHLPRRATWIITLAGAAVSLPVGLYEFSLMQSGGLDRTPGLLPAIYLPLALISLAWLYHIWHQLREIHCLHRDHARVQLDNIRPMYALSRVTAWTALGLVLLNYGWFAAQPGLDPTNPVTVGEGLFSLALALVVFVWPLWGAHRKLVEAKEAALAALGARKQAARQQVHQALDRGELERIDVLNKALGALQAEGLELKAVPTWPWAPGTLRNLMGAVLLPVVLWLIQFGLGRLLG